MRIILRAMDLPGKSAALYRPRKSPIGRTLSFWGMSERELIVHCSQDWIYADFKWQFKNINI